MTEGAFEMRGVSPERIQAFEGLRSRLEILSRRAELLGMEIHAVVEQAELRVSKQADVPLFGASLGKLPLAAMAIENLQPHLPLELTEIHGVQGSWTAAELVEKMLKYSDNNSFNILAAALGGPEPINAYYDYRDWRQTRVRATPNGRALLAETTALEAIDQLHYILGSDVDNDLSEVARQALSEQHVDRYGIRQLKIDDPGIHVFNKTGEYNGDASDPCIFRHDVGAIIGPQGRVSYAVMTAMPHDNLIPNPAKKFLSNSVVKQFGAELVEHVGGIVERGLGSRAVRSLINRS